MPYHTFKSKPYLQSAFLGKPFGIRGVRCHERKRDAVLAREIFVIIALDISKRLSHQRTQPDPIYLGFELLREIGVMG